MRFNTEEIAGSLCCPDDQRSLRSNDGTLRCCHCGRVYPVREGGILDLLPSKPAGSPANPEYAAYYHFEFYRAFEPREGANPWGLRETQSPSWRRHRERQVRTVLSMLRRDEARFEDRILRSEEHTSELQSRLHLVCRLLLEKKKNKNYRT